MQYSRHLIPELFALLKEDGPLWLIVDLTRKKWRGKGLRPDLQFRGDTISLYLGLTKVLQIRMDKKGNLHPWAAGAYRLQERGVQPFYAADQCSDLMRHIEGFFGRVEVSDRYLSDEGRCQNWLSYRYGSARHPGCGEPVAIDREVVIGYTDTVEKGLLWDEPIRQQARSLATSISEAHPELYGANLGRRPLGNELDLLMWTPQPTGALLLGEVKGPKNAHGIYMAPVQVAAYAMAWRHFAQAQSLEDVKALAAQKRELGLVVMDDSEWNQFVRSLAVPSFVPALIVQDPNPRSTCWKRLGEVMGHVSTGWPKNWGMPLMDSFRIYTVDGPEGELEDHSEDCLSWGRA